MLKFKLFCEEIKGWKNAASDLSKFRRDKANAAKAVKLVRLKNDGTESKMHDATTHHSSEEEALERHKSIKELNPKRKVAHNLYVDGKLVKSLGKD